MDIMILAGLVLLATVAFICLTAWMMRRKNQRPVNVDLEVVRKFFGLIPRVPNFDKNTRQLVRHVFQLLRKVPPGYTNRLFAIASRAEKSGALPEQLTPHTPDYEEVNFQVFQWNYYCEHGCFNQSVMEDYYQEHSDSGRARTL